jgi:Leucine-rich repeat (LRR) protein
LVNLESLNLSHNQIGIIEKLNLPNLKKLDLSYNKIKVFCGLEKCKKV